MKTLQELLGQSYLSKFKVYRDVTLFEPYWDNLLVNRCPLCGNRLKFPLKKKIALCNGKKHKTFLINLDRLEKIKKTNYEERKKK